jgi:hypothetical protein
MYAVACPDAVLLLEMEGFREVIGPQKKRFSAMPDQIELLLGFFREEFVYPRKKQFERFQGHRDRIARLLVDHIAINAPGIASLGRLEYYSRHILLSSALSMPALY